MRHGEMRYATLLACLMPLAAWGAEVEEPSTRRYTDAGGSCSIGLPADWEVEVLANEEGTVLELKVTPSDRESGLLLRVWPGTTYCAPREDLFRMRDQLLREAAPEKVEVSLEPVPHVLLRTSQPDGPTITAYVCVEHRERSWIAMLICFERDWDALREPLCRAVRSFAADMPGAELVPAGYRTREKGTLVYAWPPSVSTRDASTVYTLFDKAAREYEHLHGRIRDPRGSARVVLIHANRQGAAAITELPSGRTKDDWFCIETGRAFACPVDPDDDIARANMMDTIGSLLHVQRYGTTEPRWMRYGEGRVLSSCIEIGRDLPSVACRYRDWIPAEPLPLETLSDPAADVDGISPHGLGWVAFFRAGPRKYRTAYDAFRKEFDETGDWRTAMERHLLSLDPEKMRVDLREFLAHDLKPIHKG